jgi:hypothetical protein
VVWWENLKERDDLEDGKIITKVILKSRVGGLGWFIGLLQESEAGCFKHGNESLGSMKCLEFLDYQSGINFS